MKKLQTTLLIITTLISIFFFLRWVDSVRPKYEWQQKIDTVIGYSISDSYFLGIYDYCEVTTTTLAVYNCCSEDTKQLDVYPLITINWSMDYNLEASEIGSCGKSNVDLVLSSCYKKERVRIQ